MTKKKGLLFDSHAHYDDAKFDEDRHAVISALEENGVGYAIDVGCSFRSIPQAMDIAEKYENIYFTAGLHPCDTQDAEDNGENETLNYLRSVLCHEKCVAIGEIGLDYYWDDVPRDTQKKWFRLQLDLARQTGMPVVIHDRDAHGDTMDILREYKDVSGILHSFSGSPEMATELIKNGWYISFSGVITFKNASKTLDSVLATPAERLLLETDCPYLAPVPMRGKTNHSGYLHFTAEKAAEILQIDYETLCGIEVENAKTLFRI